MENAGKTKRCLGSSVYEENSSSVSLAESVLLHMP